ncbi:MAG: putative DNA binding domain-containing protein [Dysgonamonadaceae bacterium]|jgi:ATP-dependent DNA helicase RecG|nr:putative DNA binding domain-containing protein [Dysgonamonadaceae bacterium]
MEEGKLLDKKSLRFLKGKNTDWDELAKDCISFASSHGGNILIGVEDDDDLPPANQKIEDKTILETIHKKISERTVNVSITVILETASNKAEYIRINIARNVNSLASTTDGRYYVRVADVCKPVMPEDIARVAAEKNAFVWEELTTMRIEKSQVDEKKKADFLYDVRTSKRVSAFVKNKTDEELLDYYGFQRDGFLTNLGVLWIGQRRDRSSLRFAPIIQVIRYNEREEKVWKMMIDDFYLNPKEMLDKIIKEVPDWQESIEIPDGAYRKNIPFYPEEVIRELCTNALVHRTYTARGDIFINIHTDRLEIHNPGTLPYGVTPKNILSKSIRRNENLCKVFFDLVLMESEGSGYDTVYARLLEIGKSLPAVYEDDDSVTVTIEKDFVNRDIIRLMNKAKNEFPLKQKEIITLGLLMQRPYHATELSKILNQNEEVSLRYWLGNLIEYGLVEKTGEGKGSQYNVNEKFTQQTKFATEIPKKKVQDYKLEESIYKDIISYPNSSFSEIHNRIGQDVNKNTVRWILKRMVDDNKLEIMGTNRWVRYSIAKNPQENL